MPFPFDICGHSDIDTREITLHIITAIMITAYGDADTCSRMPIEKLLS